MSGETINYTYDSLNRLITSATQGPQWGLSFSYDGFGNRLSQTVTKGSGPTNSLSYNPATNRIITYGYSYDSNGNLFSMPYGTGSMTLSYDIENRLIQATNVNGTERYAYSPENRRVYQKTTIGTELVFFYGVNGDRLRTYQLQASDGFQVSKTNLYFAGRLILGENLSLILDRLESVRNTSRYYPFGEEQGSGANSYKFATYYRDSTTGLDYAWNRYYSSSLGRFTTPDPSRSAGLNNPSSWNQYVYVNNDPVNNTDSSGLQCNPAIDICIDVLGEMPGASTDEFRNVYQLWWFHVNPMNQQFGFSAGGGASAPPFPSDLLGRTYLSGVIALIKQAIQTRKECADLFYGVAFQPWEVLEDMQKGTRFGEIKFVMLDADAQTVVHDEDWVLNAEGKRIYTRTEIQINSDSSGTLYWAGRDSTDINRA